MDAAPHAVGVSLVGWEDPTLPKSARAQMQWAAGVGFRAVAIDGASPETRPRSMDRSARRGLASAMRRLELTLGGVDLWIPPEHFTRSATLDRALAAVRSALETAAQIADLTGGRPVVSLALPRGVGSETIEAMDHDAQRVGGVVADHAWPMREGPRPAGVRIGVDPAAALASGDDPVAAAAAAGDDLVSARLSDLDASGRVAPGEGRLEVAAYLAAAHASGTDAPIICDLRGVRGQREAARRTIERVSGPVI